MNTIANRIIMGNSTIMLRNITRTIVHNRRDRSSRSYVNVSTSDTLLRHDKLWLDDILGHYYAGYARPLLKGFDNMTYNNRRICGMACLVGSINQYYVIYTEEWTNE